MQRLEKQGWEFFRGRADRKAPFCAGAIHKPEATPAELVDLATSEDTLPMSALTAAFGEGRRLAPIGKIPVLYFSDQGVFAWSPKHQEKATLCLWLTHPAYPPGW